MKGRSSAEIGHKRGARCFLHLSRESRQNKISSIVKNVEEDGGVDAFIAIAKISEEKRGKKDGSRPERGMGPEVPQHEKKRGEEIRAADSEETLFSPSIL